MDEQRIESLPPVYPPPEQTGEALPEVHALPTQEKEASQAVELTPVSQGFVDPVAAQTAIPLHVQPPSPVPLPPTTTTATTPLIADDNDLIEKEWVEKAKQIVEQTKNDPHLQNEEINKVKADYLKKRYNHDLKVGKK